MIHILSQTYTSPTGQVLPPGTPWEAEPSLCVYDQWRVLFRLADQRSLVLFLFTAELETLCAPKPGDLRPTPTLERCA